MINYEYITLFNYPAYFTLKKEHIDQIETYKNYIDKNINQDKTIGIIIVKKDNKYIMEYCSDKRILSREFVLV